MRKSFLISALLTLIVIFWEDNYRSRYYITQYKTTAGSTFRRWSRYKCALFRTLLGSLCWNESGSPLGRPLVTRVMLIAAPRRVGSSVWVTCSQCDHVTCIVVDLLCNWFWYVLMCKSYWIKCFNEIRLIGLLLGVYCFKWQALRVEL